jgi:hypothetical protein
MPIKANSSLVNVSTLLLDPECTNLFWASSNNSLSFVALTDSLGQPFEPSDTLTPSLVLNTSATSFQGLAFADSNLYLLANRTSLLEIP